MAVDPQPFSQRLLALAAWSALVPAGIAAGALIGIAWWSGEPRIFTAGLAGAAAIAIGAAIWARHRAVRTVSGLDADLAAMRRYALGETATPPAAVELARLAEGIREERRHLDSRLDRVDGMRRELDDTFGSLPFAVATVDPAQRIRLVNRAAQILIGSDAEDARGKRFDAAFRIVAIDDRRPIEDPCRRAAENRETLEERALLVAANGIERVVAVHGAPLGDHDGAAVLVIQDITQDVMVENERRQDQLLESFRQVAGNLAHDFSNTIAGIVGYADMLKERFHEDDEHRGYLLGIVDSARRVEHLIDQLLGFQHADPVHEKMDCQLVLSSVVDDLRDRAGDGIQVAVRTPAVATFLEGDPGQLRRAFDHLLGNALDAVGERGTITVTTENTELDPAYCEASPFDLLPGSYLEISIADDGDGIAPEHREQVFRPFFTTKPGDRHTGLGLATVYSAIRSHGGAVTLYSEPGRGTAVHCYLPVETVDADTPLPPTGEVPRGSGSILLIDDESMVRNVAGQILEGLGYRVLLAENARQGLEIFERRHHDIDLVLLDMVMPSMDGAECFRRLREIRPDARVLLTSGFNREEEVAELVREGLLGFVKKPFRRTELARAVAKAMELVKG